MLNLKNPRTQRNEDEKQHKDKLFKSYMVKNSQNNKYSRNLILNKN